MKKLIIILIALLTVVGCSQAVSSDAKISEEKEVVYFKYDGKEYTNNDAFQKLKAQQVNSYFDYIIANKALEVEGISKDNYEAELEAQYQSMLDMYGEDIVNSYYGDKDSFISQSLEDPTTLISLAYTTYQKKYVEEKIDEFITNYPTKKIEYISSTNESKMKTFLKNLNKDKNLDLDKAAEKTKFENNETVYKTLYEASISSLPVEVTEMLNTLEVGTISDLITIDNGDETYTYYVIKLVSADAKTDYLNEFIDLIINYGYAPTPTEIAIKKHELIMYDDDFNNAYETIKNQLGLTESDAQ